MLKKLIFVIAYFCKNDHDMNNMPVTKTTEIQKLHINIFLKCQLMSVTLIAILIVT